MDTKEGQNAVARNRLGFRFDKLIYMEIIGGTHIYQDQPNRIKKPEYDKWENFT